MEPAVGVPVAGSAVARLPSSGGSEGTVTDQQLTSSIDNHDAVLRDVYDESRGTGTGGAAGSQPEPQSQIDQTGHNPYQGGELPPWEQKKKGKSRGGCAVM